MDNFRQGVKYSARIASHQAELKKEENFKDKKSLNISSLQTDYLNLDSSSGFGRNSERANTVQKKCNFLESLITLQKNVSKGSHRKRKNRVRLVLRTIEEQN